MAVKQSSIRSLSGRPICSMRIHIGSSPVDESDNARSDMVREVVISCRYLRSMQ